MNAQISRFMHYEVQQAEGKIVLELYHISHYGCRAQDITPMVGYCLDVNGVTVVLNLTDWPAYVQQVNEYAEDLLDVDDDPALEVAVPFELRCPGCGNRIMDLLFPGDDGEITCEWCSTVYE